MDTPEKLTKWLQKMGYEGKVPSNLRPFCNPSTALIWEQLIHSVKPRQEVDHIRNNILMNRLLKNNETCSNSIICSLKHESRFQVKEIEAWNKKRKLEQQLNTIQDRINEAESKVNDLSNHNKMKYMNLENVRQKIRENQQYTFLLNAKSKQLETNTTEVEEMLTLARNLTPIESEDQNKVEVLETLKKCADKLEKIIEKQNEAQPVPSILNSNSFEINTPRDKIRSKRGFLSVKKPFTSSKINHNRKPKQGHGLEDSLGLLDDLSVTFDNALAASSFKELTFSNTGMCYDLPILNDQHLNELIEGLLYKNDRLVIWNVLRELNECCKVQLITAIVDNDKKNSSSASLEKKDGVLTKLYAIHVEYELKTMRVNLNIQELTQTLSKMQETIFTTLSKKTTSPSRISDLRDHLKLQQKEAGLTAAIQFVHKNVNSIQESTKNQEDLQIVKERSRHVEENIIAKLSCIEHKLNVFKQINDAMSQARNETCMLARKLGQFTVDSSWTLSLNNNLNSMEIETFLDFPLEYNRAMIGSPGTFVHDLPINDIPYQADFDSNSILILITLLQSPWSPAETLLLEIIRAKNKMELLKALKYVPDNLNINGCTLEELKNQDSYITYALDKLKSLMRADSTNRTSHILTQVRETVRLWLEMPVKNFVSSKRLFNGAPYQHYEKLFEDFYKQL